jgi:hypothetical protein
MIPRIDINIPQNLIEDFDYILREVLGLIVKLTDPDHPEDRYPNTPYKTNDNLVMKLEKMIQPHASAKLPADIKNAILQTTAQLFAITKTIGNPKDSTWKTNPYPYDQYEK